MGTVYGPDGRVFQWLRHLHHFWYTSSIMKPKKNPHIGSTLQTFLREEGLLEQATLVATKSVLAWRISELMKKQRVSKASMAKRMRTSRAALDRLLDARNTSVTLQTIGRAATALGKTLTIDLTASK